MKKIPAIILWLSLAMFAQEFQGVYTGNHARLELRGGSVLTGTLEVQGQRFPISGYARNGRMQASVSDGSKSYTFEATLQGAELQIISGADRFVLQRETTPITRVAQQSSGAAFDHPNGFQIRPAIGWTPQNNDQAIVLTPTGAVADQEFYSATVQAGYSAAEEAKMVQQITQEFLKNGGHSSRAGVRQLLPNGVSYLWEALDPNSGKMAAIKFYVLPQGDRAHILMAYGLSERLRQREADLLQMLPTIRFVGMKPMPGGGALADNTPAAQQWLNKLRGKMIRQFHAYSGMSSDKRHYLNADGTYACRSQSMVSVDVPGMSGMSSGGNHLRGRWRIREIGGEVFLQIQYSDGDTGQYRLTADNRNWYMNGEKAFAVDPE